jgi:murein DD-endopeptidase MepM/ murein hydrolase activator NlpD
MVEYEETFLYRLLFLFIALLIAANIILITFHMSSTNAISSNSTTSLSSSANPSAFTSYMNVTASRFRHSMHVAGHFAYSGERSAVSDATKSVKFVGNIANDSVAFGSQGVMWGVVLIAHTAGGIVTFGVHTASYAVSLNSLIRPADITTVPVIDAWPTHPALQTVSQAGPVADQAPQWPIHGAITTQFGVPELPYERIHTGLDISDGRSPGTTPILPFKAGRVAEVVRSSFGLGNHIILDHGGGVTSVYGHLYSVSVQVGQSVVPTTILGYEGSTGASTGTHLHFEIRVNGQPENPLQFIPGHPE